MRKRLAAVAWTCATLLMGAGQVAPTSKVAELAGTYYEGDGLGVNWGLVVSPTGRFSFTWDGCLGRYDENEGDALVEDGFLTLRPEKPVDQGVGRALPLRWLPVRWGERLYLLEETDIPLFAKYVNEGWEPRTEAYGLFFLRQEDWTKKAADVPELPEKWSVFLLPKPVNGRIVELLDDHRAKIDKGSSHGLQAGMLLTAVDGDDWVDVVVRSVEPLKSIIESEDGDGLTTRHQVTSKP